VAGFSQGAVSGLPINTEIRAIRAHPWLVFLRRRFRVHRSTQKSVFLPRQSVAGFSQAAISGLPITTEIRVPPRQAVAGFSQAAISGLPVDTEIRAIRAHPWLVFLKRRFRLYRSTQKSVSSAPIRGWFF
jgi:hypothetical protein